jgi:hypothetical protein
VALELHADGAGLEDRAVSLGRGSVGASQDRAHTRRELGGAERFRHVVVSAQLEPEDALELLPARGQHHDRCPRRVPDLAEDVASVPVGEHDVEEDEVRPADAEPLPSLGRGRRDLDVEPFASERLLERLRDRLLVLDEQDAPSHG